jgi:hypothetical protein
MMEAARTSETSVDDYFTRQYIPEDNSGLHTRRRENLKSHTDKLFVSKLLLQQFDRIIRFHNKKVEVKQSHNTPMETQGGEAV